MRDNSYHLLFDKRKQKISNNQHRLYAINNVDGEVLD